MSRDPMPEPGGPMGQPLRYAELHCITNFTFLRGASHPQELIAQAWALGYEALAITDECSVAGVVRAHMAVKKIAAAQKEPNGGPVAPAGDSLADRSVAPAGDFLADRSVAAPLQLL